MPGSSPASRRPYETGGRMSRVYAIESTPTLLGAKADHRLALHPAEIAIALRYIAGAVGAGPREWTQLETGRAAWLAAAAEDLSAHRGRVLVHAGSEQPEEVHLLVNAINSALGAFGADDRADRAGCRLAARRAAIARRAGRRHGGRQGRHAADARHEPGLQRARRSRFRRRRWRGCRSRSAWRFIPTRPRRQALWLVPKSHEYETWSDARAFNGAATIQQPQVLPLYGGQSAHEVLAVLQGNTSPNPQELVREHWRRLERTAGQRRVRARSGTRRCAPASSRTAQRRDCRFRRRAMIFRRLAASRPSRSRSASDCCSVPTRAIWDGRFADNAWLLELPRPFTRLTWDNAALIAPQTAARLGARNPGCGADRYRARRR